jgi:hypothetical protein
VGRGGDSTFFHVGINALGIFKPLTNLFKRIQMLKKDSDQLGIKLLSALFFDQFKYLFIIPCFFITPVTSQRIKHIDQCRNTSVDTTASCYS